MKPRTQIWLSFVGSICLWMSTGCPGPQVRPTGPTGPTDIDNKSAGAVAQLESRSGSLCTGEALFAQEGDMLRIVLKIKGATPGDHGAHIHEKGDCSAADGSTAGGHFNPGAHDHGGHSQSPRHAGDLGNITVAADGTGVLDVRVKGLTLADTELSVLGRAILVHEKPDDLRTQPSGNSGARICCGVVAKPAMPQAVPPQ